ncbi:ferric-dicitrate binding protein FerR (iron transport regulator) [Hymenobacter luteus]|uniref:Ferric-dicitrate binding protein FerR (Iron transport regulator) n=2 Tax=Hymenobacter TaxID=89966 RepID=A0A7W9T4Q4_9BACT|nr:MULTISPECIES: FecR domain-containing protein [Hymenobacter]MBB4603394.1 ferric-dicitrate binding protein FerR (iron transport regulator) [Hymenobacter latericoloratus]MBB6061048.1 ferric-dicitrate binding protein FerR (iron transport regulator) [Hymenobacter luteus]
MELSALHELIGKDLAGELSAAEHEVLDAWLAQASPDERLVYEETRRYWQSPVPAVAPTDTAAALERLLARLEEEEEEATAPHLLPLQPASASEPWWRTRLAASVAALLLAGSAAVGYWGYRHYNQGALIPLAFTEKTTARGATAKVLLADGTAVWLNADSRLWFPLSFKKEARREVYLQGEAFFEVTPNRRQPFVIHLGREQVRVLGTSFNVKAYEEDETVETAVVTGRVAFIHTAAASTPDTMYAVPNQRVVYSKSSETLRREEVNSQDYATWSRGGLVFQGTSMTDVARTLERHFNVRVQFANEQLRNCRLTGRFRNQTLREVISILSLTGSFGFELTDNQLLITGPGCAAEPASGRSL